MKSSGRVPEIVRSAWPPIAVGVVFLTLWELFIKAQDIREVLLPAPSGIWRQMLNNTTAIRDAMWHTGLNALIGLVAGVALGVVASFVGSRFKIFSEIVTPLATALGAIPIVVLVAQFYNMFSQTSEIARRLMTAVAVFFAVYVNLVKGLRQVTEAQGELMQSYAATDRALLTKVRVPAALPFFFTALKIAAATSVITAFVSEYFGGRQNGLGYAITSAATVSKTTREFAFVAGACVLGLGFYLAAVGLEYVAMPYRRKRST